jgi:hypothetical protein
VAQPPQRKAPADARREALEREVERLRELQEMERETVEEATTGWLTTFAIATTAIVLIAGVAVLIVLLSS